MKNKQRQHSVPQEWQETELASVGSFSKGAAISKDQLSPVGHNAVRYGELYTRHHFHIRKIYSFISDEIIPLTKKIKYGDILFAGSGETIDEIGKSAAYLLREDAYAGGDIIIFRPRKANSLFLSYFLNIGEARKKLRELGQGQSVVHIYKSDIEKVRLHIPPLPEQDRIVAVLETWDRAIEKLTKKIEIKKEIKKWLVQELLSDKTRFPGFCGPWMKAPVGEVVVFFNGKAHERDITDNGKYIVINSKFISTNGSVVKYTNACYSPLKKGDVTMVMSDVPNGKAIAKCFLVDENDKYTLNQRIGGFRSSDITSAFLYYLLNRNGYFLAFDDGVNQTNLRRDDILECPLYYPPLSEQKAITTVLIVTDKEIEGLEQKLSLLQDQKKYLLNNLITGVIRTPKTLLTHIEARS